MGKAVPFGDGSSLLQPTCCERSILSNSFTCAAVFSARDNRKASASLPSCGVAAADSIVGVGGALSPSRTVERTRLAVGCCRGRGTKE